MSSAELAALREAYVDAEEWMLEGVCASLDGLRGDRAGVRETLGSFLGELDGETMEKLADAWAPRAREGAPREREREQCARERVDARRRRASGRWGDGGDDGGGGGESRRRQRERERETRASRRASARPVAKRRRCDSSKRLRKRGVGRREVSARFDRGMSSRRGTWPSRA